MAAKRSSHFSYLKSKWVKRHQRLQKKLWDKHAPALNWLNQSSKQFMAGSLASLLMVANPVSTASQLIAQNVNKPVSDAPVETPAHTPQQLIADLDEYLPRKVSPLSGNQENVIAQKLSDYFGLQVSAELEGKRLNRSYGLIGAEQHLMRYPGDTMETHFATAEESKFAGSGMAPGRGAWGYFTSSRESMTQQDVDREKYYIAVQTFLAPGWHDDVRGHYNFFRYHKMLVVNPENGKAMIVVIGDSGPAEFTGKHLGGSPEVMSYLERQDGAAKGPVLYFFINDPDDKVPLGPISIHQ